MADYFTLLKEYVGKNCIITEYAEKTISLNVPDILGFSVNDKVRCLYEHYEAFKLTWLDNQQKYVGSIDFVGYDRLDLEHENLDRIMNECYDTNADEFNIAEDILNWYPLIWFANGDAFCLDKRNGSIVFYEHEVFDSGKNLHSLKIAVSLNELFERWSVIHFADIYYWDEVVNDSGIDLSKKELLKFF